MEITDKRINKLIKQFERNIGKMGLGEILDYTDYPGGIVWITEKQLSVGYQNAVACTKKVTEHGSSSGQVNIPLFKIVLVKERVIKLSDREVLFLLAHEYSHILILVKKKPHKLDDWMCDALAEYFFGYKREKGSLLGYLHDKEAFTKVYGKKKADEIFKK